MPEVLIEEEVVYTSIEGDFLNRQDFIGIVSTAGLRDGQQQCTQVGGGCLQAEYPLCGFRQGVQLGGTG